MLHEVPRLFLTDTIISNSKCPSDKDQIIYWDHPKTLEGKIKNGSQAGLGLRVTNQGAKAFVHTFHLNGKRKRTVIGKFPTLNVANARMMAQTREAQIEDNINPDLRYKSQHTKHTLTLNDVIQEYFTQHMSEVSKAHSDYFCHLVAPWLKQSTNSKTLRGKNRVKKFKSFGEYYGEEPAESIVPLDIGKFIKRIESDHVANAALKHIAAMYNWAIRMQLVDIRNPCSPFKPRKIMKQKREYTSNDIAALAGYIFNPSLEAGTTLPDSTAKERQTSALMRSNLSQQNSQMLELCNFLGILFLTMARPNELKHAKFEHFDLERLIWHKHNTKGIKLSKATYEHASRSVPIHPKVAELVTKQKDRWPDSELAFPSHADITKPRDNFRKSLARFKQLPDVPAHFQMYDVKRIAISLMLTGQGIRREDLSHYVDHKGNLETTMIYDLGFVDPMRPVTNKLGELLGV